MVVGFLRAFCVAAGLMAAVAASAQTFDAALDDAGDNLAAALGRQGFGADTSVGIARFMGNAGVACEPMSSLLTGGLRRALVRHTERMGVRAKVVEELDPKVVRAVVSGRWYRGAEGKVRLSLKLGDVSDMKFTDLAAEEVTFDTGSLPPDARRCVLELEPIEREVTADRPLLAREAPSSVGKTVTRLETGETVWVSARVLSEGAADWFVVRLPDDETMPVGMRERRAFVYGVTLPDDIRNRFKVTEIEAVMLAEKTAKVRAEPTVKADEIGVLSVGDTVPATGRVVDRDWIRVSWMGEDAYVFAPLLKPVDAAEAAAWNKVKDGRDRGALESFLAKWSKGALAALAKQRLDALGPPPLAVQVWTERKIYRAGEIIKVFIKGNKDFYARVVYRDAGGNLVQLLPNTYRSENRFTAGKTYAIPDDRDRFDLEVGEPFGQESIILFAATTPIENLRGEDIGGGLTLLPGSLEGIRDTTRGIALKERPGGGKAEFAEASAELKTGP